MNNKFARIILCLALAPALFFMSGCAAVVVAGAAGAGAVAYVRGELAANLDRPLDKSVKAVRKAMKKLKFGVIKETSDTVSGEFTARTSQDKKILIKLKKITDNCTEVTIRVDTFGDQELSQQIWDEIKEEAK